MFFVRVIIDLCNCLNSFLPELTKVDLSHNSIVKVMPAAFASQQRLKVLNLEGNDIAQVDQTVFQGLDTLEVLNLRGNGLTAVSSDTFSPMAKTLQELDLSENRISLIQEGAFKGEAIKC